MVDLINIPYSRQIADGYCLPACAQMALAYLGILRSQEDLARTLGIIENIGVPASHVLRLRSKRIQVEYRTEARLSDLRRLLAQQTPVIAFIQTGPLAYWQGQAAQHAVMVVGMHEDTVYLLDPAQTQTEIAVSKIEFLLAWDEMAFTYAIIVS